MDVYRFGDTGDREAQLLATLAHFERVAESIPYTRGTDVTQLSEAAFIRAITGMNEVSGFGATDRVLAFNAPILSFPTLDGVVKLGGGIKKVVKKVGDTIKEAWSKLTNWIFKGALQNAADFFLYAFITKPVKGNLDKKRKVQLQIIDLIAKVTGSKRETVMTAIASAITKRHGKTPAQILNSKAGYAIAGQGIGFVLTAATVSAAIAIIQKIAALFKKGESVPDAKEGAATDSDFTEGGYEPSQGAVTTPTTTAPTASGERTPIPTPKTNEDGSEEGGHRGESNSTTPAPAEMRENTEASKQPLPSPQTANSNTDTSKKEEGNNNTIVLVGVALLAVVLMNQ
ncbi:MAG: hypothetical protein U5L45_15855 [Saprospiraceae bacterium]|nr:hypothetical protein [Saprospiraceae bacterium]